MGKFSDRVFGANVDKKTIDIFNDLQRGQYEFSPSEPITTDLPEHSKYLGEKGTFARMWVAVATSGSDVDNDIFYYSMNDNKFNSYEPNESIADTNYLVENIENPYIKPNAGITSITSRTEGPLGAVRRTTVEFVVHNKDDFDNIYLPFFLRPGATVVVDYGWSDKNVALYDINDVISNADTELKQFKKFIYGGAEVGPDGEQIFTQSEGDPPKRYYNSIADDGNAAFVTDETETKTDPGWVDRHKGLVDTNIGIVTTYSSKVTQNGSFGCSVELVSQNATILDNEISADNSLKFIFVNKIEDILIQSLTGENLGKRIKGYDTLSAKDKEEYLYGTDENPGYFRKAQEDGMLGYIPADSVHLGIYYESNTPNNQNTLYISIAVLNDLFLNNFIAKNKENETRYEINFKLSDYYVRFEENLYRRQVATMSSGDELPVFLYPEDWTDSIDGQHGENTDCGTVIQQKDATNPYGTAVIPLRELFISVSVIKEAFQKKQNVNDAINYILDSINSDSYGIFDLKMISPNRSYSEIGIQDRNLNNPLARKGQLLTFDVTSGNSVVINMDYSFETPKGDLQNMLAIGSKTGQSIFDVTRLDNLNFLNILKSEKFKEKDVFFKSLPFNEVIEPTHDGDDVNQNEIDVRTPTDYFNDEYTSAYEPSNKPGTDESTFGNLIADLTIAAAAQKSYDSSPKDDSKDDGDDKSKGKILFARSDRDFWGKKARLSNILSSQEETISPILPITLTLTVYGNTFLNIGDIFTINFLPKAYMDYVYFQIVGVEHKIDTKWETTYQTAFRIRPAEKKQVIPSEADVKFTASTIQQELNTSTTNDAVADSVVDMEIVDVNVFLSTTAKKMIPKPSNKDEEINEKGNLSNILDTFLKAEKVTTTYHVWMAYAWTETILEYITQKQSKKIEVFYNVRKDHTNLATKVFTKTELEEYDIIVDVDVKLNSGGTLKQIYKDKQSDEGWGKGISDDQEVVEQMFKNEAKKQVYKNLITYLKNNHQSSGWVNIISEKYAPIIARVRFKTADLGSAENGEWFLAEPKAIVNHYIHDFISDIKLPIWFVNNDLNSFLETFKTKLEKIKIPEKK